MPNFNLLSERLAWAVAEESQRLGRRIYNSELAELAGVSRAAVTNWMKDINGMEAVNARPLGWFLHVDPIWLETGKGKPGPYPPLSGFEQKQQAEEIRVDEESEYVAIKRVDFKISAGISGFAVEYLNGERAPIFFRKDWLARKNYDPQNLHAIPVSGASMESSLFDGDLVVINTAENKPMDGEVFAANYEGELVIKRFMREGGQWWLTSDNPDKVRYKNKLADENCFIIGHVIYKQSERI